MLHHIMNMPWILNTPGLRKVLKKCCITDASQDSEYSSGSKHDRIQNMSELHKILNKTLNYRYLIGLQICPWFFNARLQRVEGSV